MAVNFEIETVRIKVGKEGFFDVRGLNTEDLTYLTVEYIDDMKAAVAKYGKKAIPADALGDMIMTIAKEFGPLSTEIISRAADAPDDKKDDFRRLSFHVSIKALKAIFDLTMIDGGIELGNLGRAVAALLEVNGLKLGPLGTKLNDIISTAEKTSAS